nr:MAG TPA: hypothetical protein [Inoviridae sp.]
MVIDSAASHILYNLLIYICFIFFVFVNTLPFFYLLNWLLLFDLLPLLISGEHSDAEK